MQPSRAFLLLSLFLIVSVRADVTFVQKVEGGGDLSEMTLKVKGDKVRLDMGPGMSTLLNGKTGDITTLMHEEKMMMRISGTEATDLLSSALESKANHEKPQITATGRKETINGYEAEEYTCKTAQFSASYWLSKEYPGAAEIMKQLHAATPQMFGQALLGLPDFRQLSGVPLRSHVKHAGGEMNVSTVAIKLDPVSDAEFEIPKGYKDMLGALGGD